MLENFILQLHHIPFWVWLSVPTAIIACATYFFTKNISHTVYIVLAAMLIGWITAAFHFWEQYLLSHFIGEFDAFGLPSNFSRTGFSLLLDGWQLWLIPALLLSLLVCILTYLAAHHTPSLKETNPEQEFLYSLENKDVASQLEVQQLKRQIELLQQHLSSAKKGVIRPKKSVTTQKPELKRLQSEASILEGKNREQANHIKLLEEDVVNAKELIEKLLEERAK